MINHRYNIKNIMIIIAIIFLIITQIAHARLQDVCQRSLHLESICYFL